MTGGFNIATGSASDGTLNVTGAGSTLVGLSTLRVAKAGEGTVNIQDGGSVSNTLAVIAESSGSEGNVTVGGAGSSWVNSSDLYVAGSSTAAGGEGILNIEDDGTVQVDGNLKIWSDGTVNLDGGTLTANGLLESEGSTALDFTAGLLNVNDPSQLLVAAAGGNMVGSLDLGPSFVLGAGQTMNLAGTALADFGGELTLGGGTITSQSMLIQTGGTVKNSSGSSSIVAPVLALAGSTIEISNGDLALGDPAAVHGFGSAGTMHVGVNAVTLQDANDAVFDSLAFVTLGNGSSPGTLNASNGLTLDFGGNIAGFGTIDTPNDPGTPVINNGNLAGTSLAEPVTLTGYVKGVGTCDNCNITGTDAPGFSPAAVNRGSVAYNGRLEIEIGGLNAGSEFDQVNHILGAGAAQLGGELDVLLINDFSPAMGDSFEIITADGGVTGTFDTTVEDLPSLDTGLAWDILYGANNVVLFVTTALGGDFDLGGNVDGRDFLFWQRGISPTSLSAEDLGDWMSNFGSYAAVASSALAVPEPGGIARVLAALLGVVSVRRLAR